MLALFRSGAERLAGKKRKLGLILSMLLAVLHQSSCAERHSLVQGGLSPSSGDSGSSGGGGASYNYYVYVANSGSANISGYSLDTSTGTLTPLGAAYAAGGSPYKLRAHPSNKFLYVADTGANKVYAYSINQTTGALTQLVGSPYSRACPGTGTPVGLNFNPAGTCLYATNQGGSINGICSYSINTTDGTLTAVGGYGPAGLNAYQIAVNSAGTYLYMNASGTNTLYGFSLNADCSLTAAAWSPAAVNGTTGIVISPNDQYLYSPENGNDRIQAMTIGGGGAPSVNGGPFTTGAGSNPYILAVDLSTKYLYANHMGNTNISAFSILGTGQLSNISNAIASPSTPNDISVDVSGKYLLVANSGGVVSVYTIDSATGGLSLVGSTAAGTTPYGVTSIKIAR